MAYVAVFIGVFLEGEILMLSSMLAIQSGYLNMYVALVAIFSGAYIRDGLIFLLARNKGRSIIEGNPKVKKKLIRVAGMMEKYPILILLTYRMLYGFATVIIIFAGVGNISGKKFSILSATSILIWMSFYGLISYFGGNLLLENIHWAASHKLHIILIIASIGAAYWLFAKRKVFPLAITTFLKEKFN